MTVSRYTPETFSHPLHNHVRGEGLDRQKYRRPCRKEPGSQSLDFRRLPEIILADGTSDRRLRTRVCAERGARLTYDKNSARSFLPSFLLLTLMAQGHTEYYYFHSFSHVCLSVCLPACLSVRQSVHPLRSSFPRLSPLSGHAPSPTSRKSLFRCFRGLP